MLVILEHPYLFSIVLVILIFGLKGNSNIWFSVRMHVSAPVSSLILIVWLANIFSAYLEIECTHLLIELIVLMLLDACSGSSSFGKSSYVWYSFWSPTSQSCCSYFLCIITCNVLLFHNISTVITSQDINFCNGSLFHIHNIACLLYQIDLVVHWPCCFCFGWCCALGFWSFLFAQACIWFCWWRFHSWGLWIEPPSLLWCSTPFLPGCILVYRWGYYLYWWCLCGLGQTLCCRPVYPSSFCLSSVQGTQPPWSIIFLWWQIHLLLFSLVWGLLGWKFGYFGVCSMSPAFQRQGWSLGLSKVVVL